MPSKTFHFETNLEEVLEAMDDEYEALTGFVRLLWGIAHQVPYNQRGRWQFSLTVTRQDGDLLGS